MSGKWKVIGVSEIGKYHIYENMPNQDSIFYKKFNNSIIGAIADGVGSKIHSDKGSSILTKEAVLFANRFYNNKVYFENRLKKKVIKKLYPINLNDALSTFMLVIIKKNKIYIAKVGDGIVVVLGKNSYILEEENKLFVNFTSTFARERLKWYVFDEKDIDFIFLATDGISDDITKKVEFTKKFRNHFIKLPKHKQLKQLKNMLQNWVVKGSNDDKSVLYFYKEDR